jgi:hypothetical protein
MSMTRCSKCGGCLHVPMPTYDDPADPFCLNCGKRVVVHGVVPVVEDLSLRLASVLCGVCHERPSLHGREMCVVCSGEHRGRQVATRQAARRAREQVDVCRWSQDGFGEDHE